MRAFDVIRAKRDGERLTDGQLRWVLDGYVAGQVPDYQMAALVMAIYLNGMDARELSVWTTAMMESGRVMDLSAVPGIKVDKHSTGGVGDKVSLPLAPLVAACGVPVPMISGRGLGHTGGTLDKLESIPGFSVNLSADDYARLVGEIGLCLIGQTEDLVPADRKLYALRDVTATVASIPLIASSIMSKKMAEGIDALVLDVKVGSGAFMKTEADARTLAETMVGIGREMGREVVARLTGMHQPLGRMVGNALEVVESIQILKGKGPADTVEVVIELGAEMLVLGGVADDLAAGRTRIEAARSDGSGLDKFRQLVMAQGGTADCLDNLPSAPDRTTFTAQRAGFVSAIDTEGVGVAGLLLGAGRETKESTIDPAVGLEVLAKIGDRVDAGQPLVEIHHRGPARLDDALRRLGDAYVIADEAPAAQDLLIARITGSLPA